MGGVWSLWAPCVPAGRLGVERLRLCSAVSIWETVAGLCQAYRFSIPSAQAAVRSFIELNGLRYVGIGEREFDRAALLFKGDDVTKTDIHAA